MSSRSTGKAMTEIDLELNRLNKLTGLQLMHVLEMLDKDPMPDHVKELIAAKINSILNYRLENLEII